MRRPLALALALLPATALAVPAGRSGELDHSATPSGLAVSDDERFVVMTHAGDGGVTVWDRTSFLDGGTALSVCADAKDVAFAAADLVDERFYVACGDGSVHHLTPEPAAFPATWAVSDPITLSATTEAGDVVAVDFAPGDNVVHAVLQNDGFYSLWVIGLTDDAPRRVAPTEPGLGTISRAAIGEAGAPWILADSSSQLRHVSRSGDAYAVVGTSISYNRVVGLAVSSALDTVFVADAEQSEVWTVPASSPLISPVEHPGVVTAPVAFALGGTRAAPFLWVGESGGDLVAARQDGTIDLRVDLDGQNAAAIAPRADRDGGVYVAGTGGVVRILSDRPFVSALDSDATRLGPGEVFTLAFTANADADWDVRVGGDLSPTSGTSLATGLLLADEEATVTLDADDLPSEGGNRLFLFVDSGAAEVGNDSIVLTFDGPPDAVGTPTATPADERLDLRWMASDQADIATYDVYLSDVEFTADALPSFVGTDGTTWPRSVPAGEPSTAQSLSVEGLVNGVTYYLAVRAVDEGGQIGPLSPVVSGAPQASCGAAECAGEPLGCSTCSSLAARDPAVPSAAWLLLGALAWLLRRR